MPRLPMLLLALAAPLAGCQNGRELKLFGYSTKPQYDDNIRTVYVAAIKNVAFQTTPNRDFEVEINRALIREIESRTRMKVVSDRSQADTELLGTLTSINKNTQNITQQNNIREQEIPVTLDVVWRDLRSGKVLSNRRPPVAVADPVPFDPSLPPVPTPTVREVANPVRLTAVGRVVQELGESNASANLAVANSLAKQVVNLMEAPW